MQIALDFYQRKDVTRIARELLGKVLYTQVNGFITGGMIVETEAYSWRERGCHAFGSKLTERTSVMFGKGGHAYVYLCYGMHHLFNIVTNTEGIAEAVLIRALEPVEGIDVMAGRRGSSITQKHLTSGPGKLTKSMGIDRSWNGKVLVDSDIWVEDRGRLSTNKIEVTRRIGIDYAGEDAKLPWRFSIRGNPWVSKG
ncbi:MAG TPA: DNA-3-methyladenine glycosylase [Cyclobacteriaceae bacterium]|nr:DNA-3-methyladenine glycosylase [Cyclobacteriaceae bacterium]